MHVRALRMKRHRAIESAPDPVEAEERAFLKKLPSLLRRYKGRFVAMYQGRVIGYDRDDEELGRRMYEKFGEVPFYVAKVVQPPTISEVPSPEVAKD